MPYIKQARREELDRGDYPDDVGELNYLFTRAALDDGYPQHDKWSLYGMLMGIATSYMAIEPTSESRIYNVMGALTCAQMEFVRRTKLSNLDGFFEGVKTDFYLNVAVPFWEQTIAENGDVYGEVVSA